MTPNSLECHFIRYALHFEFFRFHDGRGGDLHDGPVLRDVLGQHRDAAGVRLDAEMPGRLFL